MPFHVYILTNRNNTTFYTGVMGNLKKRIGEHKLGMREGFTKWYRVEKLVYYEAFIHARDAIAREKRIKGGSRQKKIDLIRLKNRQYIDLALRL